MLDKKRLKKIKLIVLDLDGTLLNKYGEIGEPIIPLIKELKSKGVQFSFATGRLHNSITSFAELLGLDSPLITLDGAIIKSYPQNLVIHESFIKQKYVERAIKMADDALLKVALSHDESIYYTEENSLVPKLMEKYEASFKEIDSYNKIIDKVLEIVICGDYKKPVKEIEEKMKFPSAIGLKTSFYKSNDQDGTYFLEVRNKISSKGDGVLRLCKHLGISIKNTVVMGDWYNDRSMFRTKALKIAVANAVSEIKNMADFVTQKSNDENGVAEFLQMVIESKR